MQSHIADSTLACGTGRLLIPIAESGVTVHGLDSSQYMLDVLRRKTADLNIEGIELYNQPMEEFSLPTQYDAIFVGSESFQLLTSPESSVLGSDLHSWCFSAGD
jgi:ubiquinone/menaquinone biosynthesis C-methylase UbiE